jgi:predicted dithiol-disulfide oxidoreductase (DUF899 family)
MESYRQRMGWKFRWVSSNGNAFNYDFCVSFTREEVASGHIDHNSGEWDETGEEWLGVSAFFRDNDGAVFRTYSSFGRGVEATMSTYAILDMALKGRNETEGMGWLHRHDQYDEKA